MAVLQTEPTTARPAPRRPRARWWVVVAALVTGALVASSGVALLAWSDERLAAADAVSAAAGRAGTATVGLVVPVSAARTALAASAGRVDDEVARSRLSGALDEALAATHEVATARAELDRQADRLTVAADALVRATAAVGEAVARWELAQAWAAWSAAADRLDTAIAASRDVLAASAGRVADDGVRRALLAVVDAAQAVRDAAEPAEVDGLTAATTALAGAAGSLVAPQAAVTAAVESWEQARAAAAAAAAARTPAARTPAATGGRASSQTTAPSGGAGHWEETVTNDDSYSVCMDTEGNSWFC